MNLLHKILWVGAGICVGNGIALIINITANKANAATYDTSNMTIPTVTYDMVDQRGQSNGVLKAPDFSSITFRHLGSFSESGYISNEYDPYVGYALGRQWRSGDLVTDILKLGDIDDSLKVGKLTLSQIMAKSDRDPSSVTLEQIGLIDHQTVATFLRANPQLLDDPIKTIPPLADLVSNIYGYQSPTLFEYPAQVLVAGKENQSSEISLTKAVKQIPNKSSNPALLSGIETTDPKNPQIDVSELKMGNLDLNEYTLGDVEGIGDRHSDKPVFYWNNGYRDLVKLSLETHHLRYSRTTSTETCDNPLLLIQEQKLPEGLYIFDNLLDFDLLSLEDKSIRESQIYNCANRLVHQPEVRIILLGEWIQLSPKLRLKLNQIQLGLPNSQEIAQTLEAQIKQKPPVKLISACQGLSWGDIYYELAQSTYQTESIIPIPVEPLAEKFLSLKENILNNSQLKLEYFSKIEIPRIGGNDLLNKFLFEKLIKLNEPNAHRYGLKPPKAMLFVGPPGTGKSLTAKMTAKALGYTLMGMSFGDILSSDNPDRIVSLLLELAQSMGKTILFLDDWDKGLGNWESGGAARRIVQKFLTWMQEHTSSVITIATVNRIELLPAELIRRFDDGGIWMLDLPNRGAIYDIFNIYLAKCFPNQFSSSNPESVSDTPWDMEQWNELIDESEECTPVEIADVVQTCLVDWYCSLNEEDRASLSSIPTIDFEYLLTKVMQINKASVRASESIQAMRNNAWFAKPASSPDLSPFKLPEEVLLGGG